MALDLESIGHQTDPIEFRYGWHETVTYALGVGTKEHRLDYLYEGLGPKVWPTFATIPTFAAFDALVDRITCDRRGMVHHSQRLELYRPLAPAGVLRVSGRVAGLYDLKRFAMAVFDIDAVDEAGDAVVRGVVTLLLLHDGRFGGERPPRSERITYPAREPDFTVRESIPATQALLYRLNGDANPLHADPGFAQEAGFDRPILHGLCTFGYVGRVVLEEACDADPARMTAIQGQFSAPVFPGDTLIVEGWREDGRVLVRARTEERPSEVCLSAGYAEIS